LNIERFLKQRHYLQRNTRKRVLNNVTFDCAKSIALPRKVINLSSSPRDFIFLPEFTQEKEREGRRERASFARRSASSRGLNVDGLACTLVFLSFSSRFFFLSLVSLAVQRERLDRWMGDDSVQRGVRNFHARTSRRAGQAAPAAHTGETHESGVVACRYHREYIVYV